MKKQWRTILIMGIALVALILVWVGSTLLPGQEPTEATTTTSLNLPVIHKIDAGQVTSISVRNETDSYTLLPRTVSKDGKDQLIWTVEGMDQLPFDTSLTEDVANVGLILYASKEISAGETNLAPYGLDNAKTSITVRYKSGETHTISFGNQLASGYYDYAILDGKGTIYSVASSTVDDLKQPMLALLDKKQVIGIEAADLKGLVFERAKDSLKIAAECEYAEINNGGTTSASYTFKLSEPIVISGNADSLTNFTTAALNLSVTGFVELNPADLSKYGLDLPQYTITLQSAAKTVTVRIGKMANDTDYYMISDAVPVVFKAARSSLTNIDMPFVEMIERLFSLKSIWLVDHVKVSLPDAVFTTEIDFPKDKSADDEEVKFTLNGQNAKIFSEKDKSLFTSFYQRMIALQVAGADPQASPVNTHDGSITYYMKADTENNQPAYTEVIEFAKRDDYTYYVFIDGEYTGFYIDGTKAFTSAENGNEGIVIAYKKLMYAIEHAVDGVFNTEEGYQLD